MYRQNEAERGAKPENFEQISSYVMWESPILHKFEIKKIATQLDTEREEKEEKARELNSKGFFKKLTGKLTNTLSSESLGFFNSAPVPHLLLFSSLISLRSRNRRKMKIKLEKDFTDLHFSEEEWRVFLNKAKSTKFSKNAVILKQGDPINCLFRVKEGCVRLSQKSKGQIVS